MKKLFAAHHRAMAATYKAHAEGCDDGDAHKALFHKLAGHHHDLAEALGEGVSRGDVDGSTPDYGRKSAVDRIHTVYPSDVPPEHLRLIPRAGGPTLEKATVAPEHEAMFDI